MDSVSELNELLPNQVKMEILDPKDFHVVDGHLVAPGHSETNGSLNEDESNCMISQFDTETDLSLMQSLQGQGEGLQGVFQEIPNDHSLNDDSIAGIEEIGDITLIQLMDIRTRLSKLMAMLEKRIGSSLTDYEFWLQDSKMLESHKTLVDQCIRGEGIVQVNVQIKPLLKRINIMDVLKPDEEFIDTDDIPSYCDDASLDDDISTTNNLEIDNPIALELFAKNQNNDSNSSSTQKKVSMMVKWVADAGFKADQQRLNIPQDPYFWTVPQVSYWIQWAVRQFHLTSVKLSDWNISGSQLCALTLEEFKKKCPSDPVDLFWTHIEVLRTCKFIAIVQNEQEIKDALSNSETSQKPTSTSPSAIRRKTKVINTNVAENKSPTSPYLPQHPRSGNNGQIQLWQFLLEMLTSTTHTNVIQWIGSNGEFKLQDPEYVAKLWGLRKHKPTMNYEKLSRALRYYYDGDMIAKVHNKRFVYRFVCDLKQLIGYDASDLARLVNSGSRATKDTNLTSLYW